MTSSQIGQTKESASVSRVLKQNDLSISVILSILIMQTVLYIHGTI